MTFPNFIIVGETKCGTTSMYDNLIQHPQILPSRGNGSDTIVDADVSLGVKEIRFFDRKYDKGWDWYKSCFPECPEGTITGEASPTYFARGLAIDRILSVLEGIKLIVMLRNPVDRLISHYGHMKSILPHWELEYPTIEDFWNKGSERDYYLIDRGMYPNNLKRIIHKDTHVIISEEFFSDPTKIMSDTFKFLGVDEKQHITPKHSRKKKVEVHSNNSILSEIRNFYQPYIEETESLIERKIPSWKQLSYLSQR